MLLKIGLLAIAMLMAPAAYAQEPTELKTDAVPQEPGTGSSDDSFVDKLKNFADDIQIVDRLNGDVDGWYPHLGGMTRGSGFAIGPGYRAHVFDDRIFVNLSAGVSTKGYRSADANVRWFRGFTDRVELWTDFRYEHFPQEDFYGMGLAASVDAQTSYEFDSRDIALRGLLKPVPWMQFGTTFGYVKPNIRPGSDQRYPSIEQLFTDAQAPGLAGDPNFLHTTVFAEIDRRDVRGNPASGGFYRVSYGVWDDHNLDAFDFRRLDGLLAQHVPLVASKKHVLSGRVGFSYTNNETGQRVPFYVLPYVGGVDTVRSFNEFRFKDENALWLGAEYRWVVMKYASVVAFVDAGEVQRNWQDIDLTGMKKAYGFGVRAHTRSQTFARLDFGTGGGEGWQIFLKLGPSF